jgi:hypothetical protein
LRVFSEILGPCEALLEISEVGLMAGFAGLGLPDGTENEKAKNRPFGNLNVSEKQKYEQGGFLALSAGKNLI